MYCSNCGRELREGDIFCAGCGLRIIDEDNFEERDTETDGDFINVEYCFFMPIIDVFINVSLDTVVTGVVESGSIKVNDNVMIVHQDGSYISTKVLGLEKSRAFIDCANKEDNIGVLLEDIKKDQIQHGDVLVKVTEEIDVEIVNDLPVEKIYEEKENESHDESKQNTVDVFMQFFGNKNIYGSRVYIFGVDMIPDSLERELKKEFKYRDGEELLLAFDGKNYFECGFLLTDKSFYWKDTLVGNNVWNIDKIQYVNKEKRNICDVLYFVDRKNKVSKDIYLTGIEYVNEFAFAFKRFIDNLVGREGKMSISEKIIEVVFWVSLEMSPDCVYGKPIGNSNSKLGKARVYFVVPQEESIYFILDSTAFGSCKEGFAIGNNGIYYCVNKKAGRIGWSEFKAKTIKKGLGSIKIDNLDFICTVGSEKSKLLFILNSLKALV